MPITVEGPGGQVIEFPDETPHDTIKSVMAQHFPALDFSRPVEAVRADIAKIPAGPGRDKALNDWADAYVAKERGGGDPLRLKEAGDIVRNVARGTLVGSFADEANAATSAGLHKLSGGRLGAPYDESLAYQRALDRAIDKEQPIGSTALQVGGALATGAPIAKGAFKVAEKVLPRYVAAPIAGTTVGGTAGTVAGIGAGEGTLEQRLDHALNGDGLFGMSPTVAGATIGAFLPPAATGATWLAGKAHDIVTPAAARLAANARELRNRLPASADGGGPDLPGARAHAEQMLANAAAAEGNKPGDLTRRLNQVEDNTKFWTSGQAQDVIAPVDLTPGMQRFAASAARANTEVGRDAKTFLEARQTGITPPPPSGARQMAEVGIPTRARNARPLTAEQSKALYQGRDFGAGAGNPVSAGQEERIGEGFKRALLIYDKEFHGHQSTGYQTAKAVTAQRKTEADKFYPEAWRTAEDFSLDPAFEKLREVQGMINDPSVTNLLNRVMRLFSERTGNGAPLSRAADLKKFDLAKQRLDGVISGLRDKDPFLAAQLTKFKNDMLDAVHGGDRFNPTRNVGYSQARGLYSGQSDALDAYQMGVKAFSGNVDEALDYFHSLDSEGLQKLFRLGVAEGYRLAAGEMKLGADKTQLFDRRRAERLLSEVIPRDLTDTGRLKTARTGPEGQLEPTEGALRPEKFGRYIDDQKTMVETRNVVQGGSQTQKNKRDDDNFDIMSKWQEIKENSSNLTTMAVKQAANMLSQLFGMRQDTAAAAGRMLFTADPIQRRQVILAIERRLGRNRMEQFTRIMDELQRGTSRAGVRQGAQPAQED